MMMALKDAWRYIDLDQRCMQKLFPKHFNVRSKLRAFVTSPSIRAAFWMRVAARGGIAGRFAREQLIHAYSCDVSAGLEIRGGIYLPHPVGIVLGQGVVIEDGVSVYQGVTIGGSRSGRYPHVQDGVVIYPGAVIAGGITVGARAVIGAGIFVDSDVPAGRTVRASSR